MVKKIALIGIDGSGKSTHLSVLSRELQSKGFRHKKINLRGAYFRFFSFPLLILCRLLSREGKFVEDGREYRTRHPNFGYPSSFIMSVWATLFLMDVCILALFRGYFLSRVDIILCDRCIIDSIVDLMASSGDDTICRKRVGRIFLSLMKPHVILLMDVEEEKALKRGRYISSLNYLRLRRPLYQRMASDLKIPIIDSTRSFTTVHREILEQINNSYDLELCAH